jgi:hypothetical protein
MGVAEKKDNKLTALTVSGISETLVADIDIMAKANGRSRSAQTVFLLREIVAIKRSMNPQEVAR